MAFLAFMNTVPGRIIRVVAGLALIAIGAAVGGGVGIGIAVFALAPIATGAFGVCPINPLVGQPLRACAVPRTTRAGHSH